MVDHVGTTQQGSGPWTSPYLVTGSYREDEEDVVYNFSGLHTTGTHFWIADDGENSDVTIKVTVLGVYAQYTYPSAYTKIKRYADGDWEVVGNTDWLFSYNGKKARLLAQTGQSKRRFYYGGLINLYNAGNVQIRNLANEGFIIDVESGDDDIITPTNGTITLKLNDEVKNKLVWEILGRMCHLLQDMSVPAHAHGDAHGECDDGVRHDTYEKWVGSTISPYNSPYLAISHNGMSGFLNPIGKDKPLYYLMYRVQQVADHFGSNGPYNGDGNDYLPVTSPSYYNIPLYTLPTSPTSINDFLSCCHDLANEPCYNREATSLQNRINIRDATLPIAISATTGLLYWFAVETGLITNITVLNNFVGGTVKVNNVTRNSPFYYSNIVGLPLSLEAVRPQNDGEGYQRIWNNFAPNAVSLWRVLKGSSSYDILPPNIQHSFVTTQADNKSTYLASLRKNYKIDVDHQTEFDGLQVDQSITYIVEQNSGQISAPTSPTINGRTYNFAGWTDGNGENPRTIQPTDNTTYTALYKIPFKSNNETAYANNSQRKLAKDWGENLWKVYESLGQIWLEKNDELMNGGRPVNDLSQGPEAKSPCLDYYFSDVHPNEIYITYQQKTPDCKYKIMLAKFNELGQIVYNLDVFTSQRDYASFDAAPVIAVTRTTAYSDNKPKFCIVWRQQTESEYQDGLYYWGGVDNGTTVTWYYEPPKKLLTTDSQSSNPTIAVRKNPEGYLTHHVAWQQGDTKIKPRFVIRKFHLRKQKAS